jgi:two-component system sensor kinase FixL
MDEPRSESGSQEPGLLTSILEQRWRAIVDSAVDGIVVIDQRGRIEAFNAAAEQMFGYTVDEVRGRNVSLLMPSPYHEEHDRYLERYLTTHEKRIIGIGREVSGRRRDGTIFPMHLSVGEMRMGAERHFTGICHDLTERVKLEERLREQEALARLGEMAAVLAHEIRNPLAAVRGAIQVLGGRLPAASRDAPIVTEIVARLDALNDLVNDLLLFAKTPAPRLVPVALAGLLAMVAELLKSDPVFADVRVRVEGRAVPVPGDPELLKIAFQNILINAAQAIQGPGSIAVSVAAADGRQRVTIEDSGPGIAPEARSQMFRPFFTTKARGTGLGLSITRRLIEMHHGTIAVECPDRGGTRVTVELPESGPHQK